MSIPAITGGSVTTRPEVHAAAPPPRGSHGDSAPAGFTHQTVSGVFDSAFDLYKRNFGNLALIVACIFIPTQVLLHAAGNVWLKPLLAQTNSANPDPLATFQVMMLVFVLGAPQSGVPGYLSLLASFMASGPVALAVAGILVGQPISVGAAYRRAIPMFWRLFCAWNLLIVLFLLIFTGVLIGVVLLIGLITVGLTYIGANANVFTTPEAGTAIAIVMIATPYVVGCCLSAVLLAFSPTLIALEDLRVMGAVERNTRIVDRKVFWRVCLTVMVLPLVIFGLQFLIMQSAASVVQALKWPAWAEFVANTGLSSLISFFFQPYWMAFITLLYFDVRVRREGLDVRYLADNLPELDPLLVAPVAMAVQAASPPMLAGVGGRAGWAVGTQPGSGEQRR